MVCENCGNKVLSHEAKCRKCGHTLDPDRKPIAASYSGESKSSSAGGNSLVNQKKVMILSVIIVACVLLVPMCNRGLFGASIFPNDSSMSFSEVWELITENFDNAFNYYVVDFTVIGLVAGILLFISSLDDSRILCSIFSGCGVVGFVIYFCKFLSQEGSEYVFTFDESFFCIGFWIVFVSLIMSFIESVKSE